MIRNQLAMLTIYSSVKLLLLLYYWFSSFSVSPLNGSPERIAVTVPRIPESVEKERASSLRYLWHHALNYQDFKEIGNGRQCSSFFGCI